MLPHEINDLFSAPPRVRFAESFGRDVLRTDPLRDLHSLSNEHFHLGMYFGYHCPLDMMNGRIRAPADCSDVFGIRVDALHHVT